MPFDKIKFSTEPVAYTGVGRRPECGRRQRSSPNTTTGSTAPHTAKANPWYPDHAMINGTKDELKAMPEFKYE